MTFQSSAIGNYQSPETLLHYSVRRLRDATGNCTWTFALKYSDAGIIRARILFSRLKNEVTTNK